MGRKLLEKNGFALAVAPVGRCAARRCCGGHAASRMRARNPDGSEFTPSRSRVPARTLRDVAQILTTTLELAAAGELETLGRGTPGFDLGHDILLSE